MSDADVSELKQIRRVADQGCSAHARLRDRCRFIATLFDLVVLCASAWAASLAFVDPALAPWLVPERVSAPVFIGLLSVVTFMATLVQLKLDYKGRADAHARACAAQAEIKRVARDALRNAGPEGMSEVRAKLALASTVEVNVPEREFLRQKAWHLRKVAMSRHLDANPFASVWAMRARWWWRDNAQRRGSGEGPERHDRLGPEAPTSTQLGNDLSG